ncbi:hypothetical protein N7499_012215 [Penicillium canescens]|nr:hypothetical protein N7522_003527 [Penicillium canescens]KAJ6063535.1 hypothetical protein N7499_012215 [Penicillium canescens]KAJ6154969.1 hypothetical protein N7485_013338 [Penicillium canescens]
MMQQEVTNNVRLFWEPVEILDVEDEDSLESPAMLADAYSFEGRWEEAELLDTQVMVARKTTPGKDNLDTLASMASLAFTWESSGHNASTYYEVV